MTTDTWQRRAVFRRAAAAEIVERLMFAYRDDGHYLVHRYVIMPDHLHALLTPGNQTALEKGVQLIKGGSSHEIHKALGWRFPVWRPGFTEHLIRDQDDYDIHVRYIDQNPVKAGLAETAKDYRYSAAFGRQRLDPWPGASGAEAPVERRVVSAGLKPRSSADGFRVPVEGRDSGPAVGQNKNRGSEP